MIAEPDQTALPHATPVVPGEHELREALARAPHRFLDVGHSRLAYWRFGRGPDVVFVHGWPLTAATFRHLIPRLADAFTCHLVDLPGAGLTEHGPDTSMINLSAHAATVRAAIDALGLAGYALVAHDSGGLIARMVAAGDPARVRALVLGNTEIPGHAPWLVTAYALAARLPGGTRLIGALMRSRTVRRSRLAFRGCFADPSYLDGDFHDLFVAPLLSSPRARAAQLSLLRTIHSSDVERLVDAHARISAPVQLVWGTDDPFFPIDKARGMLEQFAGPARLDPIEGGKLFAHEDRAADFAALARPFLAAAAG